MSLARAIRSAVMRRFADPRRRAARREKAERARQLAGRPHEVLYFHQVDDPYSQLAVQALGPLLARYDIRLLPKVVAKPTPIAIHEQRLWDAWASCDAAAIAPHYGLRYDTAATAASAELLSLARRLLLTTDDAYRFAELARQVSAAVQGNALDALQRLAAGRVLPDPAAAEEQLAAHYVLRHQLRHYLGGMFHYAGEWYWGIDRLHYLEQRLDALGARRPGAPATAAVARQPLPSFTAQAGAPRRAGTGRTRPRIPRCRPGSRPVR